MSDPNRVTASERLWSQEVGLAAASEGPKTQTDWGYEWSNGVKHYDKLDPYSNPAIVPEGEGG